MAKTFNATMPKLTIPDGGIGDTEFNANDPLTIAKMEQRTFAKIALDLLDFRVHDDRRSFLPDEATADDLGLETALTFGTNVPMIDSGDAASASITRYACTVFALPPNYEGEESIQIRLRASMQTISDDFANLDAEVFKRGAGGAVSGSDLVSTSAQSANSATSANYDFNVTATGLAAGDTFDLRIAALIDDTATGSGVVMRIEEAWLLCDTRGG